MSLTPLPFPEAWICADCWNSLKSWCWGGWCGCVCLGFRYVRCSAVTAIAPPHTHTHLVDVALGMEALQRQPRHPWGRLVAETEGVGREESGCLQGLEDGRHALGALEVAWQVVEQAGRVGQHEEGHWRLLGLGQRSPLLGVGPPMLLLGSSNGRCCRCCYGCGGH